MILGNPLLDDLNEFLGLGQQRYPESVRNIQATEG